MCLFGVTLTDCSEADKAMTNQQLKATIQAALATVPVGGPGGTLDELGTYHAGELARHRHDPQALSRESHPELLG
jgi:hypothetical protein